MRRTYNSSSHIYEPLADDGGLIAERLGDVGLAVTATRCRLLSHLEDIAPRAVTPIELYRELLRADKHMPLMTVRRVLGALSAAGLIARRRNRYLSDDQRAAVPCGASGSAVA